MIRNTDYRQKLEKKAFAFFDADGTILNFKSMVAFERFYLEQSFCSGTIASSALAEGIDFIENVLPTLPRAAANEHFWMRFAGREIGEVAKVVADWHASIIKDQGSCYHPAVVAELRRLRRKGVEPAIVSGSSSFILSPFADELGIDHVLGTQLETSEGRYTGKTAGRANIGDAKADCLHAFAKRYAVDLRRSYAFGDHSSDAPMLQKVGNPRAIAGDSALERIAASYDWQVLSPQLQPVLICGAGPTGLVTAIKLQRAGVPYRLIERKLTPDRLSKALSLNPATLELMAEIGVVDQILAKARTNPDVEIAWKGETLHEISLGRTATDFAYFAMIPQYETEKILRDTLLAEGGSIDWGAELDSIQEANDQVCCGIRTQGGHTTMGTYSFLVGADGSRSTVRGLAGIPFSGHNYDMHFAMMDAEVQFPGYEGRWIYFVDEHRFAILIPMKDGLHRVVIKADGAFAPEQEWHEEAFRLLLDEMGLQDLKFSTPSWTSAAPFFNRLAATFRKGPILLAGDAAHLFSPIGGQGLNTGVQDARHLSEVLIAISRGESDIGDLDVYARARRAFAMEMGKLTDTWTRLIARIDCDRSGPLRHFMPGDTASDYVSQVLPQQLAGLVSSR